MFISECSSHDFALFICHSISAFSANAANHNLRALHLAVDSWQCKKQGLCLRTSKSVAFIIYSIYLFGVSWCDQQLSHDHAMTSWICLKSRGHPVTCLLGYSKTCSKPGNGICVRLWFLEQETGQRIQQPGSGSSESTAPQAWCLRVSTGGGPCVWSASAGAVR